MGPGVATRFDLGNLTEIAILEPPSREKIRAETDDLGRVGIDITGDAVHALRKRLAGRADPGWRNAAVRVRRQDGARNDPSSLEVLGGQIHRAFASPAGIGHFWRKTLFDDMQTIRNDGRGRGRNSHGAIATIVGKQQNLEGPLGQRRSVAVPLHRKGRKT